MAKSINSLENIGSAVPLLRRFRMPEVSVNMLLTDRCNIKCDLCLLQRSSPSRYLDTNIAYKVVDELKGAEKLFLLGGEPFLHPEFMKIVQYAAPRVNNLYIDTNGSFLNRDLDKAAEQVKKFPQNTIFILSLDSGHSEALKKINRSLEDIFLTLEIACKKAGLGLEISVRTRPGRSTEDEIKSATPNFWDSVSNLPTYFGRYLAQGEAHYKNMGARIRLDDFLDHINNVQDVGIFITPNGLVVSGEHAAFLNGPPDFTVWGDLHDIALTNIFQKKLDEISASSSTEPLTETSEKILNFIADQSVPITWNLDKASLMQIFQNLPDDKKAHILEDIVQPYAKNILEIESISKKRMEQLNPRGSWKERFEKEGAGKFLSRIHFTISLENQELKVSTKTKFDLISAGYRSFKMHSEMLYKEVAEFFGHDCTVKYFLKPLILHLEENLEKSENQLIVKIFIFEIKKIIGEQIDPKEERIMNELICPVDPKEVNRLALRAKFESAGSFKSIVRNLIKNPSIKTLAQSWKNFKILMEKLDTPPDER